MRRIFLLLFAFFALPTFSFAQVTKPQKNKKTTAKVVDSVKWRAEHYIVNRDSAYADPRLGLKKLQGGNKRFVEGKSIKPRQNYETIKKLENGQAPFAIIVGCSDSRVPNEMIFDQGLGGSIYHQNGQVRFLLRHLTEVWSLRC